MFDCIRPCGAMGSAHCIVLGLQPSGHETFGVAWATNWTIASSSRSQDQDKRLIWAKCSIQAVDHGRSSGRLSTMKELRDYILLLAYRSNWAHGAVSLLEYSSSKGEIGQ